MLILARLILRYYSFKFFPKLKLITPPFGNQYLFLYDLRKMKVAVCTCGQLDVKTNI